MKSRDHDVGPPTQFPLQRIGQCFSDLGGVHVRFAIELWHVVPGSGRDTGNAVSSAVRRGDNDWQAPGCDADRSFGDRLLIRRDRQSDIVDDRVNVPIEIGLKPKAGNLADRVRRGCECQIACGSVGFVPAGV